MQPYRTWAVERTLWKVGPVPSPTIATGVKGMTAVVLELMRE